MFNIFKYTLLNFFKLIGLYDLLRKIYNFFTLFNTRETVTISKINATFFTPTFRIKEDLKTIFGERDLLEIFLNEIQKDDIIWDIGASFGIYTIFSALKAKNGMICSFEPEISTFRLLNRNIKLNNLKNIKTFQIALMEKEGERLIYKSKSANIGTHSFARRTDYPVSKKGKRVKITTGDRLIQETNLDYPNLVKIDVEGAELYVLKGMNNILNSNKLKILQVEIHPKILPLFNHNENMVIEYIESFNFQSMVRKTRGTEVEMIFRKG